MMKRVTMAWLVGLATVFAMAGCSGQFENTTKAGAVTPEPTATVELAAPEAADTTELEVDDDGGTPEGAAGRIVDGVQQLVALPGGDLPPVVVNVSFEGGEVWPKKVAVPAGRQIQLVLRNRDQAEHHYHILGMPTVGIRWLSKEEGGVMSSTSDEEHNAHHPQASLVPFHICTSRSGICPTGEWIHAHANPSDMDMIIFVTNTPGRYEVTDPLHPDLSAEFTVFETVI